MNPAGKEGDFADEHGFAADGPTDGADEVDGLLASARQSDAASQRRRRRWREDRSAAGRDLDDVLLDAVGSRIVAHLRGGHQVAGTLHAVGIDLAQFDVTGRVAWVRLDAIDAVEVARPRSGDPTQRDSTRLADVLEDLAATGAEVRVDLCGGGHLSGTVIGAGASVQLRRADRGDVAVIRPGSVAAVVGLSRW